MTLLSWPNNSLSKKCDPVEKFDEILKNVIFEMKAILEEEKGLGLAAPQVGYSWRLFILKTKEGIQEIINPEIISFEGQQYKEEGCLSFKGVYVNIQRPESIHFKYKNENGEEKEAVVYGQEAVCFAHEFDHLEGKTILNHVNRKERKKIEKYLKNG